MLELIVWWWLATASPFALPIGDSWHGPCTEWDCVVNIKPIHFPVGFDKRGGGKR